jgi:hypothetical protein
MGDASRQGRRTSQLLLNALRTPADLPGLSAPDWDLLLRVARRVRLLGRIEADLSRASLFHAVPERVARHLRSARNLIQHRQTLATWEVNRVLWAIRDIDVPLTVLKGTAYVLAQLPPARGRLFADLDLLVPEDRIGEVESALLARGWFRTQLDPYDDRYYRIWMHEIPPLRHRERRTEIDIHHRILSRTSRLRPDPAPLFAAARPLSDPRLRILSPTDMVLHALVHLFLEGEPQEGLRLRDLVDVGDLVEHFDRKEPDFWGDLVSRATQLGLERPLFYGLHFSRRFLGTQIPEGVRSAAESGAPPLPIRMLMGRLVPLALLPDHPDHPRRSAALARWLIYMRAHWLRMPPLLLARHLGYKASLKLRGVRKRVDPAQVGMDLR